MAKREKLTGITRSWAGRTFEAGRLAAGLGRAAARKVLDREALAEAPGDASHDEALVDRLDQLKGLMMKFGQMASYLDGAVPEQTQRALRRLQSEARGLPWPDVRAVIEADLGRPVGELFDDFDPEPFAAASIGQVHRARLDGREWAVKVQYPGVADTFETDLGNLRRLAFVGSIGTGLDGPGLVAELRARMHEECDYRIEAANLMMFRRFWKKHPGVVLPEPRLDRLGKRVLTAELIAGKSFADFAESASDAERSHAGELLFDFAFGSIFGACAFNADPHPGNYLFLEDGRVAFLDFGCTKRFEPAFVRRWKRFATATLNGDYNGWKHEFDKSGFTPDPRRFDYGHQWQVMQYLYEPMMTDGFRYTHNYVRKSYDLILWKTPNQRRIALPPDWLAVQRLQWGLNSVLAHLDAAGDWGGLFRAAIAQPTEAAHRPDPLTLGSAAPPQLETGATDLP